MGILPDFFPRKENPEEMLKEKILKAKLLRQQKKTSPKKTDKPVVSKIKLQVKEKKTASRISIPQKTPSSSTPLTFETVTFYSQNIRKLYFKNHWYFFLEDVVAVSGVLGLEEVLVKLKQTKEYKENSSKFILSLPVTVNGQTQTVECVDDVGFMWILPLVRSNERIFPGPFPDWLKEMSKFSPPVSLNN